MRRWTGRLTSVPLVTLAIAATGTLVGARILSRPRPRLPRSTRPRHGASLVDDTIDAVATPFDGRSIRSPIRWSTTSSTASTTSSVALDDRPARSHRRWRGGSHGGPPVGDGLRAPRTRPTAAAGAPSTDGAPAARADPLGSTALGRHRGTGTVARTRTVHRTPSVDTVLEGSHAVWRSCSLSSDSQSGSSRSRIVSIGTILGSHSRRWSPTIVEFA